MNSFLNPVKSFASSSEQLNDRDKQKRIHTWLGEQTTDYLKTPYIAATNLHHPTTYTDAELHRNLSRLQSNGMNGDYDQHSNSEVPLLQSGISNGKTIEKLKFQKVKPKAKVSFHSVPTFNPKQSIAATKIQALWRGHFARTKNPRVVDIRHEIRSRRTEQYIATLCNEIGILKQKQKADRKLRELQTEAIRFMWSQIREMQSKFDTKVTELEEKLAAFKVTDDANSHSSFSKENSSIDEPENKEQLKNTVEKLQAQVIQLQDALLSFSDRLVSENDVVAHSICGDEENNDKELSAGDVQDSDESDADVIDETLPQSFSLPVNEDDEILSARDNVPKITVQSVLEALDSSLTEKELWSFCEQAMVALKAMKVVALKHLSPSTVYIRKDGLVSFSDTNFSIDTTYSAPELSTEGQKPIVKSLIFSLAVTMWSAADFNMTDDQAPCLSTAFENLLVKMSQDEVSERADVDEVLEACAEHHFTTNCNSLQVCASLFAETSDMKKGKKRQIKSVSFTELFAKEIEKTRCDFQASVVPQLNTISFQLKPASERQLSPKPTQSKSPYEKLMEEIRSGITLKKQEQPKLYTVQDMFRDNPELIQKLNILPGQRRKNVMAVKAAIKKLSSSDGKPMLPSPPQALKAEIKVNSVENQASSSRSLILRWHPSYVYDKYGNKVKSGAIIGYRIYVNRQPKGMVNGVKCRALLDGLKKAGEYRIYICAISALGESEPSNTVIANLDNGCMSTYAGSPSPNSNSVNRSPEKVADLSRSPVRCADISGHLNQSGDVVERVLQRYGIKKSSISHSTSPTRSSKQDFKLPSNLPSFQLSKTSPTYTGDLPFSEATGFGNGYAASSSSSDDHITPRTKALLDQLKHELLG